MDAAGEVWFPQERMISPAASQTCGCVCPLLLHALCHKTEPGRPTACRAGFPPGAPLHNKGAWHFASLLWRFALKVRKHAPGEGVLTLCSAGAPYAQRHDAGTRAATFGQRAPPPAGKTNAPGIGMALFPRRESDSATMHQPPPGLPQETQKGNLKTPCFREKPCRAQYQEGQTLGTQPLLPVREEPG